MTPSAGAPGFVINSTQLPRSGRIAASEGRAYAKLKLAGEVARTHLQLPAHGWALELGSRQQQRDAQLCQRGSRQPLNQAFWLEDSPQFSPGYAELVDNAVEWAKAAGLDVILDLHWSDGGTVGGCTPNPTCQQPMADERSLTFWSELASRYRGDGRVLFELYNEPHDVSWQVWKSGGMTNQGFRAAGMQQLYDAVRAAGADNLVVIGGTWMTPVARPITRQT